MAVNFVKFQRGSEAAYNKLLAANRVDNDTLYFIYDEDSATIGKLYLGKRLIDGGGAISGSDIKLEDLKDVIAKEAQTNSFLIKDGDFWVPKSIDDIIDLIGAKTNYKAGLGIDISIDNTINIKVSEDEQNIKLSKEKGLFTNFDLNDYVKNEKAQSNGGIRFINQEEINKLNKLSIEGEDITISGSIEASQVKNLYDVIANIVTSTGDEDFDTEKEGIQKALGIEIGAQINKIESVNTANFIITEDKTLNLANGKSLLTAVQAEKLDSIESGAQKNFISTIDEKKFTVTEGKLLLKENYIPAAIYAAEIGDLSKLNRDEGRVDTTLVDEINYINERLTWGDLTD